MKFALYIALPVALACFIGGAGAQTSQMTLPEFASKRLELRSTANTVRIGKCRGGVHQFGRPAYRIPRSIWGWNLTHWRRHVRQARNLSSACSRIHHRWLWECVHAHEGSWTDPNDPYFGGLQMGRWFMATYGARLYATKGTADHWTPEEQMSVADRAYHNAGHSSAWLNGQWPGTSSECGA